MAHLSSGQFFTRSIPPTLADANRFVLQTRTAI
jgi:hypothetical protein